MALAAHVSLIWRRADPPRATDAAPGDVIQELFDIVDAIYDAATDPGKWDGVLRTICRVFDARGGNLVNMDMTSGDASLQLLCGFDLLPHMPRFIALRHEDPRIRAALRYPGKPLSCHLAISESELHGSRVYRELLQPLNIEYSLFVQLTDELGQLTGLALFRHAEDAAWTQADCDRLGILIPHLRRGMALLRRFARLDRQLQTSYAVFDSMSIGIMFCRTDGAAEFLNRAARALVARDDGLVLSNGRLTLWRSADQATLADSLAAVADGGEHRAFLVERSSGATAYRCLISRSEHEGTSSALAEPSLVVYLSDPDAPVETSGELLARLYGLTPMEARVAEYLVRGCTVTETAAVLAVEQSTVRTHLKAVFVKADVHRQSDLVRQVLANPFWARSAHSL